MEFSEAVRLIAKGVTHRGGNWADLGAGTGTFTRAVANLLGGAGTVHAVDTDGAALPSPVVPSGVPDAARVIPLVGDFREPLSLSNLDGVVMANSLHFIEPSEQEHIVARVVDYLRDGGAFVLVEYDQRRGTPWVPHPVPPRRFTEIAQATGLGPVREIGRQRSRYGPKDIYAAVAFKPDSEAGVRADRT